jgi:hypothetical protein
MLERLRASWVSVLAASAVLALVPLLLTFYIVDDAYISFRYAKNLAEGHGFVFNVGSHVEGVTNLLWTVLLAAAFKVGAIPLWGIERFAIAAGLLLALAALWRADCIMRALRVGWMVRLGSLLLLAATTDLWLSMTNGLEGALFAFLLVETLFQTLIRERFAIGALAGLLCFATRPEGLLAFPSALISSLAFCRHPTGSGTGRAGSGVAPLRATALFAGAVLAISLLRYAYFESVIPNSALAKRPDDLDALFGNLALGREYLVRTATTNILLTGSFLAAPVLFLIDRAGDRRRLLSLVSAVLLIAYAQVAAILVYAGDWMPFARLVSPYFFLFGVLGSLLVSEGHWRRGSLARGLVVLCITASALAFSSGTLSRLPWVSTPASWGIAFEHGGEYRKRVPDLAACLTKNDVVAAEKIGQIGYRMPGIVVHDILGLTDAHIARHGSKYYPRFGKTDMTHTLVVVKPTVLLMNSGFSYLNSLDAEGRRHFDAHYQILRDPAERTDVIAVSKEHLPRMSPCLRGLQRASEGLAG